MPELENHKAGFVSIIGKPNVGKSTLMNALLGQKLSIITAKAQTTRHRIFGLLSGDNFQIVYSDTPGVIDPQYPLQQSMMSFVRESLGDADVILMVVDPFDEPVDNNILELVKRTSAPKVIIINKVDLSDQSVIDQQFEKWEQALDVIQVIPVSALKGFNLDKIISTLLGLIPIHPAYFPEDELTDRSERFFASEIIREKIFLNYKKEIPYSCEVVIDSFKDEELIARIRAIIYVERDSQKGILIGKGGASLKKVGIEARKDLETFLGKQVFLETHVKVEKDWRKKELKLKRFGYL
ncbi:MAG: GTPase Era [Bacteroidetes bacterium]|nr:GTPase Era [Bacteroidota bacterium]MDA1122510.1 GTPase Era [Bacteroidota bacterium]